MLRTKIVEFVSRGDSGLASGKQADGTFDRLWFNESVTGDEVAFETGVFLLTEAAAEALKRGAAPAPAPTPAPLPPAAPSPQPAPQPGPGPSPAVGTRTPRLTGAVPPEIWNRLGTNILPKPRTGTEFRIGVDFSVTLSADGAALLEAELRQIPRELGPGESVTIE